MQYAEAAVAPMRIARGVQNKVLEAMAMEKPVIVSSKGLEGIAADNGKHVLIADSAGEYVDMLEQVLADEFADIGASAHQYVSQHFNWDNNLPEVVLLLGGRAELPVASGALCHG